MLLRRLIKVITADETSPTSTPILPRIILMGELVGGFAFWFVETDGLSHECGFHWDGDLYMFVQLKLMLFNLLCGKVINRVCKGLHHIDIFYRE